ncbi:MAG: alpha/beta hydrolase [Spirochaetales bacterium]|nr:MAG: alpha/beta hydrolase [Spirochaetales bacterium]
MADKETEIAHLIMAAPDVGQDDFDKQFKDELAALSENVTVYVSSNDTALLISGFINDGKRLGRQKLKHEQMEEAKDMLYLKSLAPDKVNLIDVTPINSASYKHGYYLESPEFYDDFYLRLFDAGPKVNRKLYLFKCENNVDYWVMESGR